MALNALERHLALVGFMGAGKTTLFAPVAERLGRPGYDLDEGATEFIEQHGLDQFRRSCRRRCSRSKGACRACSRSGAAR